MGMKGTKELGEMESEGEGNRGRRESEERRGRKGGREGWQERKIRQKGKETNHPT